MNKKEHIFPFELEMLEGALMVARRACLLGCWCPLLPALFKSLFHCSLLAVIVRRACSRPCSAGKLDAAGKSLEKQPHFSLYQLQPC